MRYEVTVTIHKSVEEVVKAIQDREGAFKWIKNLKKFDLIEGEMNMAKSKYIMEFVSDKGKTTTMYEEIESIDVPNEIITVYTSGSVWNRCINRFWGHDDHSHYSMDCEFKFPWYLSIFMWLFKNMFYNQTLKDLEAFKAYVESL
jgi:uncharacterized membrane protein